MNIGFKKRHIEEDRYFANLNRKWQNRFLTKKLFLANVLTYTESKFSTSKTDSSKFAKYVENTVVDNIFVFWIKCVLLTVTKLIIKICSCQLLYQVITHIFSPIVLLLYLIFTHFCYSFKLTPVHLTIILPRCFIISNLKSD